MHDRTLRDCHILVVEDEYLLAVELQEELHDAGAIVLGPVGSVADALVLLDAWTRVDGAILDVNLGGETAFPIAERLLERGIPFVFATGYDANAIPGMFGQVARCEKPINLMNVARAIGRVMGADPVNT